MLPLQATKLSASKPSKITEDVDIFFCDSLSFGGNFSQKIFNAKACSVAVHRSPGKLQSTLMFFPVLL